MNIAKDEEENKKGGTKRERTEKYIKN